MERILAQTEHYISAITDIPYVCSGCGQRVDIGEYIGISYGYKWCLVCDEKLIDDFVVEGIKRYKRLAKLEQIWKMKDANL